MPAGSRPWIVGGLVLGAVLVWGAVGLRIWLDGDRTARWMEAKLEERTGRTARVEVDRAAPDLFGRSIRLEGVTARIGSAEGEDGSRAETAPAGIPFLVVRVGEVELSGLSLRSLFPGGGLRADGLRIDGASLRARPASGRPSDAPGRHRGSTWIVQGLSLDLEDVGFGAAAAPDTIPVLARSGSVQLRRLRRWWGRPRYRLDVIGLAASAASDSLRIDRLRIEPRPDDAGWFRDASHRRTRIDLTVGDLSAAGVGFRRLATRSGMVARVVTAERFDLEAYADLTLPPESDDPDPSPPDDTGPTMPDEWLRSAAEDGHTVVVDSLRISDGRIVYAERASASARPGRMVFEDLSALVTDLRDPATAENRSGEPRPMAVTARARVYGAAPVELRLRIPVESRGLDFTAEGSVGTVQLPMLNEMFTPVASLRIEKGRLLGLRFDLRVEDGVAGGTVYARYQGLSVNRTGPEGDQGILDRVVSLFIPSKLHSANPSGEGEEARVGRIAYRGEPDDPFFGFLWKAIRSGIFSLVKT